MLEAKFAYKERHTTILCQSKDSLKEVFTKFKNKENLQDKILIYQYNGEIINNENKTVEQLTNEKSFTILVYDGEKELSNSINNDNRIVYTIDENIDSIKLFGYYFVENNKNNILLEIEGKEYKLMECYGIERNNNNKLEIKIKGIENIINMGYMFEGCSSLLSLPDISKWNIANANDIKYMFSGCSSLSNLNGIHKWNTTNITNMESMFEGCSSLSNLPDISKWNTVNVKNMKCMFFGCSSLSNLPDISQWNTAKVNYMKCIF